MRTLIFANGDLTDTPDIESFLSKADFIIAVDGGANHCRRQTIIPDVLIGDLDSIDPAVLQEYREKAVEIHRYPPRKDATDLELAFDLAMSKNTQEVCLLGGLGGRWDMSFANILLSAGEKYKTLKITIAGPGCIMYVLHPGKPFALNGAPGQRVSFLPLHGDVHGLTLHGFEYPLTDATLLFGSTQGVSNVLQEAAATVQLESGILLCVCLIPA